MSRTIYPISCFNGQEWWHDACVRIDGSGSAMVTQAPPEAGERVEDGSDRMLVPAFVDLQIYGGGGLLFSQHRSIESLQALAAANRKGGTATCLVTIATQPLNVILECLDVLNTYIRNGGKGISGLHLEGPFINALKRGAHVAQWIHEPAKEEITQILEHARGNLKMITLAPECCSDEIITMLDRAGVVIAAGHSNAGFEEGMHFASRGVKTVTHLFNAMSALHHREPGLPMAAMTDQRLRASIIPDGIHVDFSMMKLAKTMMADRLYYITDAVTDTADGPYQHAEAGAYYALPDGTLSGSAISMLDAVRNGIEHGGFSPAESLRMASLYPAQLMGWTDEYGVLEEGRPAPMLLLNQRWEIEACFGF